MERSPLSNLPPPPLDAYAGFELRFRGADLPEEPADPAAFARPYTIADAEDPGSSQLLLESAALAEGLLPIFGAPRGERLVPIFDGDLRPIPIPEPELPELPQAAQEQPVEPSRGRPALTSRASSRARPSRPSTRPSPPSTRPWDLDAHHPTWVARLVGEGRQRTVVLVAVALPLLLAGSVARADEPASPEVQRPRAATGTLEPTPPPAPETAPEDDTPEAAGLPASSNATTQPLENPFSSGAEAEERAPPVAEAGPVAEDLWRAMKDQNVRLLLANGSRRGRLVAVDGPEIVFVDHDGDGRIYVVPKAQVMELRGIVVADSNNNYNGRGRPYGVPDPTLPTGKGLLAGGITSVAISTPFLLSGLVITGFCPSCVSVTIPLLIPGLLGVGGGIPMIIFGRRRLVAWKRSAIARVQPSVAPTRGGWNGALTLRF